MLDINLGARIFLGKFKELPGAALLCFAFSTVVPKNGPKNGPKLTNAKK